MIAQQKMAGLLVSFDSSDERMEIERWLNENINPKSYHLNNFFLLFSMEADAMAFKLRWM